MRYYYPLTTLYYYFFLVIRQGGYDDEGLDDSGLQGDDVSFTMESGTQGDQSAAYFGLQTEDGGSIMVGGSGDARTQGGGGIAQQSGNSRSGGPKKGVTFGGDSSGPSTLRVNKFGSDVGFGFRASGLAF